MFGTSVNQVLYLLRMSFTLQTHVNHTWSIVMKALLFMSVIDKSSRVQHNPYHKGSKVYRVSTARGKVSEFYCWSGIRYR